MPARTRSDRDKKAFVGPGNADGLVATEHCKAAGLHDDAKWDALVYQNFTVGDLVKLAGFHERTSPHSDRPKKLGTEELSSIVKALELHSGMNYMRHSQEAQYACAACCTCW